MSLILIGIQAGVCIALAILLYNEKTQNAGRCRALTEAQEQWRKDRIQLIAERDGVLDRWYLQNGTVTMRENIYPLEEGEDAQRPMTPEQELIEVRQKLDNIRNGGVTGQTAGPIARARMLTARERELTRLTTPRTLREPVQEMDGPLEATH